LRRFTVALADVQAFRASIGDNGHAKFEAAASTMTSFSRSRWR
jgi:hypothetical protein